MSHFHCTEDFSLLLRCGVAYIILKCHDPATAKKFVSVCVCVSERGLGGGGEERGGHSSGRGRFRSASRVGSPLA